MRGMKENYKLEAKG